MTDSDPELDPDPDPFVSGTDPDPHQNVTAPQHWLSSILVNQLCLLVCSRVDYVVEAGQKPSQLMSKARPILIRLPWGGPALYFFPRLRREKGSSYQGVTMRCSLSLLTNSALVIRVQMRGEAGSRGSQPMSTAVHIT
jgi:hypothetical protein